MIFNILTINYLFVNLYVKLMIMEKKMRFEITQEEQAIKVTIGCMVYTIEKVEAERLKKTLGNILSIDTDVKTYDIMGKAITKKAGLESFAVSRDAVLDVYRKLKIICNR